LLLRRYVEIGDQIALQYGGSEAHKKVASTGTTSNITGPMGKVGHHFIDLYNLCILLIFIFQHKELLTSIRRYYSNAFTDRLKQDAMNLFLGYYIPSINSLPLWELENDSYLHNFHVNAGRGSLQSMKTLQSMFGVNWSDGEHNVITDIDNNTSFNEHPASKSTHSLTNLDEVGRIDRVKQRCKSQNEALSSW
jgi:hypothetical protein